MVNNEEGPPPPPDTPPSSHQDTTESDIEIDCHSGDNNNNNNNNSDHSRVSFVPPPSHGGGYATASERNSLGFGTPSHMSGYMSSPGFGARRGMGGLVDRHNSMESIGSPGRGGVYHLEDEYQEDLEAFVAHAPSRLVGRQREQATMFGMPKWKSQVRKKALEERSQPVREILEGTDLHPPPEIVSEIEENKNKSETGPMFMGRSNLFYAVCFGWLLGLFYCILGGILFCTVVAIPYAKYCFKMAKYHLWPFGKYVCLSTPSDRLSDVESETNLLQRRPFSEVNGDAVWGEEEGGGGGGGRGGVVGKIGWGVYVFFMCVLVLPMHLFVGGMCWLMVIFIPTAKLNYEAVKWNFRPMEIDIVTGYPGAGRDVLICTYRAANLFYYKYSVGGMNIMLVNLLPFVFLSLFLGYCLEPLTGATIPNLVKLPLSLFSIIPLTYYIGTAISSISAQTDSFAAGAVLNATFGSICELIIYCSAIARRLPDLVQAGVTGSLLGVMLLLPGLAMLLGGLKFKEQRFSRSAAGVSSVLLLLSVVAAFLPTLYFVIFGASQMFCGDCDYDTTSMGGTDTDSGGEYNAECGFCYNRRVDLAFDPVYDKAEHLSFASAFLMPVAYCLGLIFTLKTHTHIYDIPEDDDEEKAGHDAPEWSRPTCVAILLVCTILFAALSEELLGSLEPILDEYNIPQSFAGLTIIAVIPNTAEIVNAVQFSMQGNFALSLEIGSSAAVQISLIQIPVLFLFSVALHGSDPDCGSFTLVFPAMDMLAVIFSTLILSFIAFEGKSNYFTGMALLIVYASLVVTFWFLGESLLNEETNGLMTEVSEFMYRMATVNPEDC